MGLIKAVFGAAGGALADQWKEFFYCESIPKDVLVTKGQKRITGRSSNTKGNDNVISNGSGIAVADGQCMIIVEQGKVVDVCAEPGEFTYDNTIAPSLFTGPLGQGIKDTFKLVGKRIAYGGDTGTDQRVYYFNIKELLDNKFGTPNPIPFRVVDRRNGFDLDIDVSLRCSGVYSYKIVDPLLFYTNVCGNVSQEYRREEIDNTLKTEFVSALQPAFAKLSDMELRPNQIISHNTELENAMNEALSAKWTELRGLQVVSVALGSVTLPEEDQERIKKLQQNAVLTNPAMAAATLVGATAEAMPIAAGNANGAINGLFGMGMINGMGGAGNAASNLFAMGGTPVGGAVQQPTQPAQQPVQQNAPAAPAAGGWTCPRCGKPVAGNFCPDCGTPKPQNESWTCPRCGTANTGKFCANCGMQKQEAPARFRCSRCGWEPADPTNPPKFCPQCGDAFDLNDKV